MAHKTSTSHARPLTSRPLDAVYVVWFVIHLVVMHCVDLVPLYPKSIVPQALLDLRTWYITTYNDRFFTAPPAWFTMFMWMEAVYHVPLSFWAIRALIRDDPTVPLHLLIWCVQTCLTTLVCIVDFFSWKAVTTEELRGLSGLYAPYFGLALLMGLDMVLRIRSELLAKRKGEKVE